MASLFVLKHGDAFASEIKKISNSELHSQLYQSDDQVKILFIFTTWCGVCKQVIPDLVDLDKKLGGHKDAKIFAVSLDDDMEKLRLYAAKLGDAKINVYLPKSVVSGDIRSLFIDLNISYNSSIPYIAIIFNNKLLAAGNFNVNSLYDAIRYIKSHNKDHNSP